MKNNKKSKTLSIVKDKGFDIKHLDQMPEIPDQIVKTPKEVTDPAEIIKRA